MKKNFKLSYKHLLIMGIISLTGLTPPTNTYAMSNTTQQIIQSETPSTPNYQQKNDFKLYINGERKTLSNGFLVINNRTFLPVRELSNLLGIPDNNIGWDSENRVASVSKDNTLIEIPIGYTKASVNDQITPIDTASNDTRSVIANGYTYLPLRFLSENLGYQIDTQGKTIHLYNVSPKPEIKETISLTEKYLHPFFKEKGAIIPEGVIPKSGYYSDAIDMNGDGKIGEYTVEEYNNLPSALAQSQESAAEIDRWAREVYFKPPQPGKEDGEKSVDKNWKWDKYNKKWSWSPSLDSANADFVNAANAATDEMDKSQQ